MKAALPLHRGMVERPRRDANPGTGRAARKERLAKALRENLRRRKEQARAQQRRATALPQKPVANRGEPPA